MLQRSLFLLLVCFTLAATTAHADEEDAPSVIKDEYDFSWLDPDKKIYVVQNRKYLKAKQFEFGLNGGIGFGQPYRNSYVFMPRLSYYFSESWGLSALGNLSSNSENGNFQALKDVSSVIPSVRDVNSWGGLSLLWIPFYAKINMFNNILYVDWQFEVGPAFVNSEIDLNNSATGAANPQSDSYVGFFWGTGQKFFLSKDWALRWDIAGLYYNAPLAKGGSITSNNELEDNYYFTLGASFTF
jgi:outer membrane beta-barrel protein